LIDESGKQPEGVDMSSPAGHALASDGTLSSFVAGSLGPIARRQIVEHMIGCPACLARWRAASSGNGLAGRSTPATARLKSGGFPAIALLAGLTLTVTLLALTIYRRNQVGSDISALAKASALGRFRPVEARLTEFPYRKLSTARGNGRERDASPEVLAVGSEIERAATEQPTAEHLHALGALNVLRGRLDGAIDALESAVRLDGRNHAYRADLAAAYLARAAENGTNGSDYASACEELSRLRLKEKSAEPAVLFNLALAFAGLRNRVAEQRTWTDYLALDSQSHWADEARRHLATLRSETAAPLGEVTAAMAVNREWVCREPLRARHYLENQLLPAWATAALSGDDIAASNSMTTLDRTADALSQCSHDRSFLSVAAVLRLEPHDATHMQELAKAVLALRAASDLAQQSEGRTVADAYESATRALKAAGLPLYRLASSYCAFQYYYIGDHLAAERILDGAGRDDAEFPAWTAQLYWVDGMVHLASGSPFESLELYRQALRLDEAAGDTRSAAAMDMLIAENLTALGAGEEAWSHRLNALDLLARNGESARELIALNEAAQASVESQHPYTALAYQQSAEELTDAHTDPSASTYGKLWLALTSHRCGLQEAAVESIRRSREESARIDGDDARRRAQAEIDFAEGVVTESTQPYRAVALWSSALDYYHATGSHYRSAQVLLARARVSRRLGNTERARADLLEGVGELEGQRRLVSDETLRDSYFGSGAELFDELISLLLARGDVTPAYEVAERRRERTLLDALEQNVTTRPASATTVMKALGEDEVLLQYTMLAKELVRWEVRRGGIHATAVPMTAAELRRSVQAVYPTATGQPQPASQRNTLLSLHRILIPLDSGERQARHVIVVPDSGLTDVPFGALIDPSGVFLIERYSIVVSPSASLFVACRERERQMAGGVRTGSPPRAFVFGDTRGVPEQSLDPLRGALDELRSTGRALATEAVLDGAATKQVFLRDAPAADLVYVAGHAVARAGPTNPALVVALDRSRSGDFLGLDEIRRTRFRSRLVVLSACGTAEGRGEGVTSLARAFIVAGVPAVVGTLLSVDDEETNHLLTTFAGELAVGRAPREALRQVQLRAVQKNRSRNPLEWAGFQIYGSGSLHL